VAKKGAKTFITLQFIMGTIAVCYPMYLRGLLRDDACLRLGTALLNVDFLLVLLRLSSPRSNAEQVLGKDRIDGRGIGRQGKSNPDEKTYGREEEGRYDKGREDMGREDEGNDEKGGEYKGRPDKGREDEEEETREGKTREGKTK